MKLLYCIILLLIAMPVWAQELPLELSIDELPDEYADAVFSTWKDYKLNLSGAYYHSDDPYYLAHFKAAGSSLKLFANLKIEAEDIWNNFQFSYRSGRKSSITLGNYRIKAAEGLIFSRASNAELLLPPPHPQSYSPFGAVLNGNSGDFNIYMLASDQKRNAVLLNDRIFTIPRSRSQSLVQTREQILAGGLIWETPPLSFAGDIYHQAYDRGFTSPILDSLLTVYSLSARLSNKVHRLGFQAAYATQTPALAASWDMQTKSFSQSWRYARIPRWQRPAYAAKPLKLSTLDQREELEASFWIRPVKTITLKAGSIINRNLGDIDKAKWQAQHSIQTAYQDQDTSLSLKLLSIDREVLSEVDSSFQNTIPTHYRFYLNLSQELKPYLSYILNTRYHHQNKIVKLSEASYMRNALRYEHGKLRLELGLAMWMSLNHKLYIESENDSGYEALGKDNMRMETAIDYQLGNFKLNARLDQILQAPQTMTARLGIGIGF